MIGLVEKFFRPVRNNQILRLRTIVILHLWGLVLARAEIQPKTALVLSGGGARGFAHIGVIKALEEVGFYPDLIVGTSFGAVVGALYAGGASVEEITQHIRQTKWTSVLKAKPYRDIEFVTQKLLDMPELFTLRFDENFNVVFPRNLISTQALQERIFQLTVYPEYAANGVYDSLAIPLRIITSDLKSGKTVVLQSGNLARAVTASSAFPILLEPIRFDSLLLVDGGITNNVPCDVARGLGAEFIVAVDVTSKIGALSANFDVLDVFGQAMNTLAYFSDTRNLTLADVLIQPALEGLTAADFDSLDAFIQAGYAATQPFIEQIKLHRSATLRDTSYLQKATTSLNQARIEKIRFSGNQTTRNFVLRRELLLKEGDLWNTTLARRSMRNLFSTGLFKNVYLSPRPMSENTLELTIEVEEQERTLFSFGARYDNERKASAFLGLKYRNFLGAGIDNQLYLVASDWQNKVEWNVRTVRILNTNFTGYSTAYYRYETLPLYKKDDTGGRLGDGRFSRSGLELNAGLQVKRVGLTAFGTRFEQVYIREVAEAGILRQKYDLFGLHLRIFVDNTDDVDLPKAGRVNDLKLEHNFVRDRRFQFDRLTIESTNYESLDDRTTISTMLRFGFVNRIFSYYEQYRFGGISSLPGFHQDELWGALLLNFGFGMRTMIASGLHFQGRALVGNVWHGWDDFNWQDSRVGIALGLLLSTPLGPMAVNYGYDLHSRGQFYLNIGHDF